MFNTTRKATGNTMITCNDCSHSISMNDLGVKPIQAATDMLRHMAFHNAGRAFPVQPAQYGSGTSNSLPLANSHSEPTRRLTSTFQPPN